MKQIEPATIKFMPIRIIRDFTCSTSIYPIEKTRSTNKAKVVVNNPMSHINKIILTAFRALPFFTENRFIELPPSLL
jgi:hypothetical protein